MTRTTVQAAGIVATVLYAVAIVWLYVAQPRTIAEMKTAAAVQANVYRVDAAQFALGMEAFRAGQYRIAIDRFHRADPAGQDPKTQFLVAYAHYALGRGVVYDDDEEFRAGLAAVERAIAAAPGNAYTFDEPELGLDFASADRLRERLRDGLEVTPGDLNPLRRDTERAP